VIRRRLFTEGAIVRAGQPLYEIDPLPYRAAAAEAEANLASAVASAEAARATAERYKPLVEIEAISKQDYTNAVAAARQAEAAVAQRRAARETARINLGYTAVPAPISGRIGRSAVTEGALVTANQATPLAQINQLDPIYVDVNQAATDMLRLRRELDSGQLSMAGPGQVQVHLSLEDGSRYPLPGVLKFSEVTVEPSTGAVTLRAVFPNPDGLLLPGMFVHGSLAEGMRRQALLVPQQGIGRDLKGGATAWVVGEGDKAELRQVRVSRTLGNQWLVESGLAAGERVVTEGVQRVRPGAVLKPVAANNVAPVQTLASSHE